MCFLESSGFEGVWFLVFWDKSTFITRFVLARAGSCMEKTNVGKTVELVNEFENVWKNLSGMERGVELETDELKTKFIAKAAMARRIGTICAVEALVFQRSDETGKLKECSRCYVADWGYYFNHLGVGQRIGMYCKTIDRWVSENASKHKAD